MLTEELHLRLTELFQSPFQLSVIVFQIDFTQDYHQIDFCHRKFFLTDQSSKRPPLRSYFNEKNLLSVSTQVFRKIFSTDKIIAAA